MANPGASVGSGALLTPGGAQGPPGIQGPAGSGGGGSVSTDANNKATLGSDSGILVQGTAAGIAATTHALAVSGDDPQLTNARTPLAHHATHAHGGSDPVTITYSDLAGIPASFIPSAHAPTHAHGGSDPVTITYSDLAGIPASFTPSAHASTHESSGNDAIPLDALGVPTDIVTLNASTTAHGLLRKLSGTASQYLGGDGNWSTPPGANYTASQSIALAANNFTLVNDVAAPGNNFLYGTGGTGTRGWLALSSLGIAYSQLSGVPSSFTPSAHHATHVTGGSDLIPAPTASASGLVPVLPATNPAGKFLRGDASFASPDYYTYTTAAFTMPGYGSNVTVAVESSAWMFNQALVIVGIGANAQYMQVISLPDNTHAVLDNYTGPVSSGTVPAGTPIKLTAMPALTQYAPGTVPPPPNDVTRVLRGDASWGTVAYSSLSGIPASFTPSAHAATHESGGSDAIPLDTLGATTDVTALNSTTSAHGLLRKLDNTATHYLDGTGAWSTPSATAGPPGPTGPTGQPAYTTSSTSFTVPNVGATATLTVADASWAVVGEIVYLQDAAGTGLAAPLRITAISGNVLTLLNPPLSGGSGPSTDPNNKATLGSDSLILVQGVPAGSAATTHAQTVSGDDPQLTNARIPTAHHASHVTGGTDVIPLASPSGAGLLVQVSGLSSDFIDGTNNCHSLAAATSAAIWSVRLRSFNAIGNPTFEVDQRNVGGLVNFPAGSLNALTCDRWGCNKVAATATLNAGQGAQPSYAPGTNFLLTQYALVAQIATAQATLAAGEYLTLTQSVEGPQFRELLGDVHSLQLLVYSTVGGAYSLSLRDAGNTHSFVSQFTLAANTATLVTIPNIPVWLAGVTWSTAPGGIAYTLSICLGSGSTFTAPSGASAGWQTGNFLAAPGQVNFMATANALFYVAFVQHEPGPVCSTPIDKPFVPNLDECLRYYCKSYSYGTKAGTATSVGYERVFIQAGANPAFYAVYFPKPMAKIPTVTGYSPTTGAANIIRDETASVERGISSVNGPSEKSFAGFVAASQNAAIASYSYQWQADTGW